MKIFFCIVFWKALTALFPLFVWASGEDSSVPASATAFDTKQDPLEDPAKSGSTGQESPPIESDFSSKPEESGPSSQALSGKRSGLPQFGFWKKDSPYLQISDGKTHLIYSEDLEDLGPKLYKMNQAVKKRLSDLFRLKIDFRDHFSLFFSPRLQTPLYYSNGNQFLMGLHSFSGLYLLDQAALNQPARDLLIHEMSHLYQLAQNTKWDRNFWPFMEAFATRNFILSSFALEGSAVFNESLLGGGGRLFSGAFQAFALSQIQAGLDLKSLLKPTPDPFFSRQQYAHGGWFFAFLHKRYGNSAQSRFFSESSRFFPAGKAGLSASLKRAFGKDLKSLFEEYKRHYGPLAESHRFSPGKALAKSKVFTPLNSDGEKIYFLTSDQKSPHRLVVFHKKTGKVTQRPIHLPLGKLFYKKGAWHSAGCARTSVSSVECSLFQEGFHLMQMFRSRLLMDIKKGRSLALDSRQNFFQTKLLVNNRFYGHTHSSALIGPQGELYYFKQEGDQRTLYKDKSPVFRFSAYYGYPVEADEEGLWFTAPTRYGSGLFVYKEGLGVFRWGMSDAVVSARRIGGDRFLVSEIRPQSYEYKTAKLQEIRQEPFSGPAPFQKESLFPAGKAFANGFLKDSHWQKPGFSPNRPNIMKARPLDPKKEHDLSDAPRPLSLDLKNSAQADTHEDTKGGDIQLFESMQRQNLSLESGSALFSAPLKKQEARASDTGKESLSHQGLAPFLFPQSRKSDPQNAELEEAGYPTGGGFRAPPSFPSPTAYHSFSSLRLVNIRFIAYPKISFQPSFHAKDFYFSPFVRMADPLDFNELKARGLAESRRRAVALAYTYKKYRPSIQISMTYNEIPAIPKSKAMMKLWKGLGFSGKALAGGFRSPHYKGKVLYHRDMFAAVFLKYPLILRPFWSLSAGAGVTKGISQIESSKPASFFARPKNLRGYTKHKGELDYSYKRKYRYAWSFYKKRQLTLSYEIFARKLKTSLYADTTDEWGKERFVSWRGRVVRGIWSLLPQKIMRDKREGGGGGFFRYDFHIPGDFALPAKDIYQMDFQILKVLNWSWRPLDVPLSLQRKAPFVGVSVLGLKPHGESGSRLRSYIAPFAGVEWEWNFLDKENLIFKTGFSYERVIPLPGWGGRFDSLFQGAGRAGFATALPDGERPGTSGRIPGVSYWSFWIQGRF